MVRWRIVLLLMATSLVCYFNRISITVAGAERIMNDYEISPLKMGLVYSSFLLVYTVFMIPGGWLIDRYGVKPALAVVGFGVGLCVILTGSVGLVTTPALVFPLLLIIRSATGLASVPMFPGSARTIAAWMPVSSRARANGLVTACALLGAAGTFYIFGKMMEWFDWPAAFLISGVVSIVLAILWTLYATNSPAEHAAVNDAELSLIVDRPTPSTSSGSPLPWFALLANRSLILLTISYAAVGYFQYLFFYWVQYYFKEVLELGTDRSRLYATIPNLAMAVGMIAGGWVADHLCQQFGVRRGRTTIAVCGMLAGTLFLCLGVAVEDPRWIVAWFSCALAAVGMTEGTFWVTAVELGGRQGGAAAGIFNTGGNVGGILAPVVTPWIAGSCGWTVALSVAALCCLLGAVLWIWIKPEERVEVPTILGAIE